MRRSFIGRNDTERCRRNDVFLLIVDDAVIFWSVVNNAILFSFVRWWNFRTAVMNNSIFIGLLHVEDSIILLWFIIDNSFNNWCCRCHVIIIKVWFFRFFDDDWIRSFFCGYFQSISSTKVSIQQRLGQCPKFHLKLKGESSNVFAKIVLVQHSALGQFGFLLRDGFHSDLDLRPVRLVTMVRFNKLHDVHSRNMSRRIFVHEGKQ
mmetsp:Transcript_18891/g.27944  ORF Transcript_18891/g.27944 Transcript_18891/m.27944 type:complete len:206 (+) Transcript_18891:342-959(+)